MAKPIQYCKVEKKKTQCNPYEITNGIFHRTRTKQKTTHNSYE